MNCVTADVVMGVWNAQLICATLRSEVKRAPAARPRPLGNENFPSQWNRAPPIPPPTLSGSCSGADRQDDGVTPHLHLLL